MRIVAALAVGLALTACSSEPEPKLSDGRTEVEAIVQAQIAVEAQLRDPKSVQWGDIVVRDNGSAPVVCGMFNAKNGFGGYVGERPFFALGRAAVIMSDDNAKAFELLFVKYCSATNGAAKS